MNIQDAFRLFDQIKLTDIELRYTYVKSEIQWVCTVYYGGIMLTEQYSSNRVEAMVKCYKDIVDRVIESRISVNEMKGMAAKYIATQVENSNFQKIVDNIYTSIKERVNGNE
jgi:hypothetical protein